MMEELSAATVGQEWYCSSLHFTATDVQPSVSMSDHRVRRPTATVKTGARLIQISNRNNDDKFTDVCFSHHKIHFYGMKNNRAAVIVACSALCWTNRHVGYQISVELRLFADVRQEALMMGRGAEFNSTFQSNLNPNPDVLYTAGFCSSLFKNKLCSTYLHSGKHQHSQ